MNIYVGNLSRQADEQNVAELFAEYGEVKSVKIIKDNYTGQSRGFAFVEMDDDAAKQAIEALHDTEFMQRPLVVNEARPKTNNDRNKRSFNRFNDGGYNKKRY